MNLSHYLFQLSPIPMWVFDAETLKFKIVNNAAVSVYGYTAEEFLSMTIRNILHEEDGNDIRHIKKSGEIIYVNLESTIIDFEGKAARMVVVSNIIDKEGREKDVAEKNHNEEQIKLNEERFNIISKATSDTIWDWNLITNTIIWNKGVKGIFGYKNLKDNTTSGEWWTNQIHPEDREKVVRNIRRNIDNRMERWVDEYRFLCADGSYKYVSDRGFMVFDEFGSSIRIIGSMQDISQRKQEEQWSRLLESVVINATDAVQICTGNREGSGQSIIYVNEAFTKMSGYSKYELVGASPRISQGPETDINEVGRLKEAVANKVSCEIEVINYTKQGEKYWVSQSNAPIADSKGLITHWISIQRDITQNKNYLREIEEQNKKFKEIAWIQSHLVRAPLARVMGLVDLLKNFVPGDDGDELLLHLESSAKELDAIIINIADKTPSNRV